MRVFTFGAKAVPGGKASVTEMKGQGSEPSTSPVVRRKPHCGDGTIDAPVPQLDPTFRKGPAPRTKVAPSPTVPTPFTFTDQTGVTPGQVVESDVIVISGLTAGARIAIKSGEYRINGGAWTNNRGTVVNGDTVQVRHTAEVYGNGITHTTVTIGGVEDVFTSDSNSAG